MYSFFIVLAMAAVTALIRFAPFVIFSKGGEVSDSVKYLGHMLPPAIISMLLVYCIRDVSFSSVGAFLPQLLSVAAVILLHIWRRNTLLSIGLGTALYMVLIRIIA